MKKILILTLALIIVLSAISCGKTDSNKDAAEQGKYTYAELDAMSAAELTRVLTENGMVVPDALKEGRSDAEIAEMVKSLYPSIAVGDPVAYDWTVTVDFVKDAHEVYEKIIMRASPVSGKCYVSEADGFGSKQQLSFSDDGTGQYYIGMLSSYIAFGNWTADADTVTLTVSPTEYDDPDTESFSLVFRLNDDGSLTFVSNGDEKGRFDTYLHDGDRFVEWDNEAFLTNEN